MVEIPLETIIKKVFLRLPIKSLVRFKCVNKQWFSTISHDPYFHRLHPCRQNTKLLILIQPNIYYLMDPRTISEEELNFFIHNISLSKKEEEKKYEKNFSAIQRMEFPMRNISLCGSCDGLILLQDEFKNFILWNPTIKSFRQLTIHPHTLYATIFGLCYDSSVHDYKVVMISSLHSYDYPYGYTVFSLRSSRWTKFRKFPYGGFNLNNKGIVVNGALHWIVERYDPSSTSTGRCCGVIVYYDVVKDEFKEVLGPDKLNDIKYCHLVNLRGCLCIYHSDLFREERVLKNRLKVWEMKEYGVKESWTPLFEVSLYDVDFGIHPLFFNQKGEVVMQSNWNLTIYDIERKSWKIFKEFDTHKLFLVDTYIESLVSPDSEFNDT